jgi:hypothetical protein
MSRRSLRCLLVIAGLVWATPSPAAATPPQVLDDLLGSLWTKVFELPYAENPFGSGSPCVVLEHPLTDRPVLAPFQPLGSDVSCSAAPGTMLFLTGWSSECSNLEPPPYHGEDEASLRACAHFVDHDLETPVVTFDGRDVAVTEVETAFMEVDLQAGNIFGADPGVRLESVGHGWVALLALPAGIHSVEIHVRGTYYGLPTGPVDDTATTTIHVSR